MSEIKEQLRASAWVLGERIEVRQLERGDALALRPLTIRAGSDGYAFVFRFGGLVLVGLDPVEEAKFIEDLSPFVLDRLDEPENESCELVIRGDEKDFVDSAGTIHLRDREIARLQVVAEVLSKSTVLAHFEEQVAKVFDRVEALAERLGQGARPTRGRGLLRQIGDVLRIQTRTIGRVEVTEKPEITWDDPLLDRLYEHFSLDVIWNAVKDGDLKIY